MKLFYYKGATPNFGDDLNPWMWSRLLPNDFFDNDEQELFVGIGSILDKRLSNDAKKIVFGSGYGGYAEAVDVRSENWDIKFVRGPRTEDAVFAPQGSAVCDSAILLRVLDDLPKPAEKVGVALMPHFRSLRNANWRDLAKRAGFTLIDPRIDDVEIVLSQIAGADLVITEAMHGAIVADALRTPWIALEPTDVKHRMKWFDWAESLEINLNQCKLPAPSIIDWYIQKTKGKRYYEGKARKIQNSVLAKPINVLFRMLAARQLKAISQNTASQLSDIEVLKARTETAHRLVKDFTAEWKSKNNIL